MAFANRFRFRFDSVHGVEYNIYILKDGYSGECVQRSLGRAPVLKKQKNGPICGTSLDLYAECAPGHDGEFVELYTSDPKKYRVDVYRANTLIWTGFVSTELYSEPSIAPPYDVQIVATDGLGELKLVDFVPAGLVTLSEHFRTALSFTGENKTICIASSLAMQGESVLDTFGMSINLDYITGKTYYDVLKTLLDTLHATITLYGDKWLIARETDISGLLSGGSISVVTIAPNGTRSTAIIAGVLKSVGSMGSADLWPNGNLSTAIVPARNEVVVEAPWHNVPVGIEMENWETEGDVRHDDSSYTLGRTGNNGKISKDITVDRLDCDIEIVLTLGALRDQARPYGVHEGVVKVWLEYDNSHLSDPIEGTSSGWGARTPQYTEYNISNLAPKDFTFSFPSGSFADPGTVRILISGISVSVLACTIKIEPDNSGYRDTIKIDNGARGKDDAVELTGSRALTDNIIKKEFYTGLWLYGGDVALKFADGNFSNGDFLSIIALSYATSAALARIRTEGRIDVADGVSIFPLLITFQGETQLIETYEWDLRTEDANISALSLPSNTLTVEAETITPLPVGYSGSGGGSGSGGAAGAVPQQKSFFEEDGDGNIKLKDEYGGLWAKGFMSSRGLSDDPGEEGVSLAAVWESLTGNTDDYANEKINAYHIPIGNGLSIDPATGLIEATVGASALEYLTDVQLTYPSAGQVLVYDSASSLWKNGTLNISQVSGLDNSLSIISGAIQSLQSQIDSVASRENSEELLTSIVCGYFDESGSAFSALRLTTVSKTAWGQTYWTSGGVPDNISGNMTNVGSITATGLIKTTNYIQATRFYLTDSIYFVADENGVKLEGAGFYTDSFSSAGGYSSGGGSGSIDAAAMWSYLTNTAGETTYDSVLINTAHIPDMSQIYHYVKSSDITDMATKTWTGLNFQPLNASLTAIAGLTGTTGLLKKTGANTWSLDTSAYLTANQTITLSGDVTGSGATSITVTIGEGKVTNAMLAGSIAWGKLSVAANDIVSALGTTPVNRATADASGNTIATTYATISRLDSDEAIISSALQSLQAQIDSVASRENSEELLTSIVCGYFDESGSAFSALRLTTVSKTAWGQTYWTSGGVPDNISGNMTNVGSITATGLIKTTNYIQATRFYLTDSIYFVADENGVKLEGAGFYTDSFSSAGGYSSGGGSGSIDAAAMWSYLTNTAGETTYDSVLINTAHVPDMSQIYHYVKSSDITDMATKTWVNQQSFATTARLDSDEAIISSALQSLQSQIDSVASRNCFDELSTTSLVTDTIAASNGYFNTIEGALTGSLSGNATTASYLVSSSYGAGTGKNPIYFSGGRPVASSSTEGSAGLPVFLSGGYLTACTASSLFSSLSSSAATNLSVTVAGQNRTVTLYATYDSASENISSCFGTVSSALQSLQSQIDSVATRNMFDELNASAIVADVVAASSLYGSLTGNASTASYLVGTSYGVGSASLPVYFSGGLPVACTASSLFASLSSSAGANLSVTVAGQTRTATLYATYDSDGENISSCFGTISTAIRSLQSQIDSVAASRAFDELTVTAGYFDMLTVGANLNVDGHIYARGASVAGATASASDIKFKDDLEPILPNKAIDILMELKPTGWTWNDKSALEGKHSAGLIAQDVQKILPFAVMQIDDYMYLEYSVLHAYEIAGIQNHEQRISQLETENRKLKDKIRVLEER